MDSYVERIKSNAENLAKKIFPDKALELDTIINSSLLDTANLSKVFNESDFPKPEDFIQVASSAATGGQLAEMKENLEKKRKIEKTEDLTAVSGCKVILFPNGAIPTNQKVFELLKIVKPFIIHFLDSSAMLKLWIQILIPQVEDFKADLALEIQEGTLAEIRGIEAEVANYLDHIYKYYAVRGKLVSKLAKYPHVADYKQSICELDEKMFMTGRLVAMELRNHYTTVHDILVKNMEKIKRPRSNTHDAMY
jgi:proteasome activator subunit 3 (PA28 gamma)